MRLVTGNGDCPDFRAAKMGLSPSRTSDVGHAHGKREHGTRRGVVLLVILGLLTMFAMVAVAFVILSGQARRSAEHFRDLELRSVSPKEELDGAAAQVLRGSNSPASVMGAHSLLEDVYGANARIGQVVNFSQVYSTPTTTQQPTQQYNSPLLEFAVAGAAHPQFTGAQSVAVRPSECTGCVLTFLSGPVAGVSTRIVACLPSLASTSPAISRPLRFQVLAREELSMDRLQRHFQSGGTPLFYLVNGVPFSGTGFGLLQTNALQSATLDPTALRPNSPVNRPSPMNLSPRGLATNNPPFQAPFWGPAGGANEDYDAPDFQNMLLAMVNPLAMSGLMSGSPPVPIPSMHRADLYQYWQKSGATGPQDLVEYVLRPMASSLYKLESDGRITTTAGYPIHPRFTGSNPRFWPEWDGRNPGVISGGVPRYQWDVDNDNDGIPDSVWVDLGSPARPAKDGRICKPLFAILCVDMDGRLNLNAHGCSMQTVPGYYWQTPWNDVSPRDRFSLRRGQGFGPPEINLRPLFERTATDAAQATNEYRMLLGATGATPGRYGDGAAGAYMAGSSFVSPLLISRHAASYAPLLGASAYGAMPFDLYGSPPDWDGNCALGLDPSGRPKYFWVGESGQQILNLPYEFNLYTARGPHAVLHPQLSASGVVPGPLDAPFAPGELERLLRPFDSDSGALPARLVNLPAANSTRLLLRRGEVTTEGWDLPCPALSIPVEARYFGSTSTDRFAPGHILTLLRRQLAQAQVPPVDPDTIADADVLSIAYQLLPPEVVAGQRMDVNRLFGNGRDEDNNGVVDESEEGNPGGSPPTGPVKEGVGVMLPTGVFQQVQSDPANGFDLLPITGQQRNAFWSKMNARQLYARNLYCLALLLLDAQPNATTSQKLAKRRELAQWAVNVVDFRDRDSIMTRFNCDLYPFGRPGDLTALPPIPSKPPGWNPPLPIAGAVLSDGTTVFGCERPDLLITETLALHDRRTEDLDDPGTDPPSGDGKHKTTDGGGAAPSVDNDYDQKRVPQGSLFVEVFNPWNRVDTVGSEYSSNPADPLNLTGKGMDAGVNLAQVTRTGNQPVWRLLITHPPNNTSSISNPKSPLYPADGDIDRLQRENPGAWNNLVSRRVYFNNPATLPLAERGGLKLQGVHWCLSAGPTTGTPIAPILPGRYCVIGPADATPPTSPIPPTDPWNRTYLGFRTGEIGGSGDTRRIVLNPTALPTMNAVQVLRNASPTAADQLCPNTLDFRPQVQLDNGGPAIQPTTAVIVNHSLNSHCPRLSVSEPLRGYYYGGNPVAPAAGTGILTPVLDEPLDVSRDPTQDDDGDDTARQAVLKNGVTTNFRMIHLQRLANPLLPYDNSQIVRPAGSSVYVFNPYYNPYLTVDRMPVDLWAFNGANPHGNSEGTGISGAFTGGPIRTRERGVRSYAAIPPPRDIWVQDAVNRNTTPPLTNQTFTFAMAQQTPAHLVEHDNPFLHTLGFCNFSYGGPEIKGSVIASWPDAKGYPRTPPGANLAPFPWFNWNNRPFVSQMELMLVPKLSSARLLFPPGASVNQPGFGMSYDVRNPNPQSQFYAGLDARTYAGALVNFRHLASFFNSASLEEYSKYSTTQWHRLLEMLCVPSRFEGADVQLPASQMAVDSPAPHFFHPPLNWTSNYREPGRVNLNTVFSFDVFRGLMNDWFDYRPDGSAIPTAEMTTQRFKQMALWSKVARSRKGSWEGDPAASEINLMNQMLAIDLNDPSSGIPLPSRFGNPFRSFAGVTLTTPIQIRAANKRFPLGRIKMLDEIEATLLRPDPDEVNVASVSATALASGPDPDQEYARRYAYRQPLFRLRFQPGNTADAALSEALRPWRNAYYQQSEIQRLGNLVTTRSNVYAVWITVGYFEAYKLPAGYNPVLYPDGYQLGPEVGIDSGEMERHRAFYLIDRSIPVGFMRGQDLNIDKAVLLRRFLE